MSLCWNDLQIALNWLNESHTWGKTESHIAKIIPKHARVSDYESLHTYCVV